MRKLCESVVDFHPAELINTCEGTLQRARDLSRKGARNLSARTIGLASVFCGLFILLVKPVFWILLFQMLTNAKWTKAAVRATVATPLAASTASVLRAVDWGQMARHVTVRSGCSCCAQTQTDCSRLSAQRGLPMSVFLKTLEQKNNLPGVGFLLCLKQANNLTWRLLFHVSKWKQTTFPHKPCAKFNEFYPLTLNCSQMLNVIYLYVFSPCLVQKTCPRTETPRQTAVSNLPPPLNSTPHIWWSMKSQSWRKNLSCGSDILIWFSYFVCENGCFHWQ